MDGACDSERHPQPDKLRPFLAGAISYLRTDGADSGAFSGPLRTMLVAAWKTPLERMPRSWRERFAHSVEHYLAGVLTEARNKATGHQPTIAEYIELRRATSAAFVSHALIEFATGALLPDEVYNHPAVSEYRAVSNDLLSWANDVLSLKGDSATSGGHNLVLALSAERGLSRPDAIDAAMELWSAQMKRFVTLRASVPSFGPGLDEALRQHLDGVEHSVRGSLDWFQESARYQAGRDVR